MRSAHLKIEKNRFTVRNWNNYDIIAYGEQNDYPQTLLDIVAGSVTGTSCLTQYRKFVNGNGFRDPNAWAFTINAKNHTLDDLLFNLSRDLCTFGGFAIHLNFNRAYQIVSLQHIAFENVRLCLPDSVKHPHSVALHPDWGMRRQSLKRFDSKDIEYLPLYDPNTIQDLIDACPNMRDFKGAVLYYSNNGRLNYPLPIYDAALTYMNTEEGIANILNRNAKNGFLPAAVFIDIRSQSTALQDDPAEYNDPANPSENSIQNLLASLSGDKNASKILYCQVDSRDEIPEIKKVESHNFDKEFECTQQACQDAIGRAFNQPPHLRCENIGAGFGAELISNDFKLYNAITQNERLLLERYITLLMSQFRTTNKADYTIQPLQYD